MENINIKISEEKKQKLLTKGEDLGFDNIEEYIIFVLEQVLDEGEEISEEENDEKEVREKLKDLGYL